MPHCVSEWRRRLTGFIYRDASGDASKPKVHLSASTPHSSLGRNCLLFSAFNLQYRLIMSSPSHLGLLSSSGPMASPNSSSLPQSRPMIDPLAFDNVHGLGGSLPNGNAASRPTANGSVAGEDITGVRRGGQRTGFQDPDAIPRVKDATGEKVMESFALFLEKWVPIPTLFTDACLRAGTLMDSVLLSFTEQITLPDTPGSMNAGNPLPPTSDESKFYMEQIKAMKEYELTTLYVDFGHLLEREEVLARAIQSQYYR